MDFCAACVVNERNIALAAGRDAQGSSDLFRVLSKTRREQKIVTRLGLIGKAIAAGISSARFWAYDLRAKADSDDEGSAQDRLTHSSSTQTMTYLRVRKPKTEKGL